MTKKIQREKVKHAEKKEWVCCQCEHLLALVCDGAVFIDIQSKTARAQYVCTIPVMCVCPKCHTLNTLYYRGKNKASTDLVASFDGSKWGME